MNIGDTVRVVALIGEDWHHSDRGEYLGEIGRIDGINKNDVVVLFNTEDDGIYSGILGIAYFTKDELELIT